MKKHLRKSVLLASLLSLFAFRLASCQWENTYSDKAFLSYKYKLEACADINGQDPYSKIWFSEYGGTSYSELFDLSFENSYLDFRVEVVNGRAVGKGHLLLTMLSGEVFQDTEFEYYCSAISNNWGGNVYATGVPETYGTWVYSIYWCRLNIDFTVPDTQQEIVLTFHFRGGEANPVPQEFSRSS